MKNYDNAPKKEPMRKKGVRVGSLTAHRRMVTGARNGATKRAERALQRDLKQRSHV